MDKLKLFSVWMERNRSLKESSIEKYTRAINTISNEMANRNVISKNLLDMNLFELDLAVANIINDEAFKQKNSTGNHMYSNAIKQFRYFVSDNDLQDEDTRKLVENILLSNISETEKDTLVKSRIGQGKYRENLLLKYDCKCIVTGVDQPKLLLASHIKPWSICNNHERIDVENGLLLSPNMDKLFDSGLITFTNEGKMKISSFVGKENEKRLHISSKINVDLRSSFALIEYLEYHRDILFVS